MLLLFSEDIMLTHLSKNILEGKKQRFDKCMFWDVLIFYKYDYLKFTLKKKELFLIRRMLNYNVKNISRSNLTCVMLYISFRSRYD